MTELQLRCPSCPDTFDWPLDENGTPTLRPDLLSLVVTSNGARFITLCPQCADSIFGGDVQVSPV